MQGFQAIGYPYGMAGSAVLCELALEGFSFFAKNQPSRVKDAVKCRVKGLALTKINAFQVEKGDHLRFRNCLNNERTAYDVSLTIMPAL